MPVHLLLGDSTVEIEAVMEEMKARFNAADILTLDGAETSLGALAEATRTAGLFDPERLVIVQALQAKLKGAKPDSPEAEELRVMLGSIAPTTTLLLASPGMREDNVLHHIVRSVGGSVKAFNLPKPRELSGWIRRRARQKSIELEPQAAEMLADLIGPDTVMIDTELEKLSTYARQGNRVTSDMVDELTGQVTQASVFALIDAVVDGRKAQAYELLDQQIERSSDGPIPAALGVIRLLTRQLRILLRVKLSLSDGTAKSRIITEVKLPSYYADRYFRQASRFSAPELSRAFDQLAQLEFELKNGQAEPQTGLDLFVAELARADR